MCSTCAACGAFSPSPCRTALRTVLSQREQASPPYIPSSARDACGGLAMSIKWTRVVFPRNSCTEYKDKEKGRLDDQSSISKTWQRGTCRPLVFQSIRGRLLPVKGVSGEHVAPKPHGKEKSFCTSQWMPRENVRRPVPLLHQLIPRVVLVVALAEQELDSKAMPENV